MSIKHKVKVHYGNLVNNPLDPQIILEHRLLHFDKNVLISLRSTTEKNYLKSKGKFELQVYLFAKQKDCTSGITIVGLEPKGF